MLTEMQIQQNLDDFEENGFFVLPQPSKEEQKLLFDLVNEKWKRNVLKSYPDLEGRLAEIDISKYHSIANLVDHGKLWPKASRLFSIPEVDYIIENLSLFKNLRLVFSNYFVADIEKNGFPEIYWRIVRPLSEADVAPAHRDSWFFTSTNNLSADIQKKLVKIWLPVVTSDSEIGLSLAAGSHKLNLRYTTELRHGSVKPVPNLSDIAKCSLKAENLGCGQAVVFHRDLLHKGISHSADITRVSIEFAIST
jgi:hypothetical protein